MVAVEVNVDEGVRVDLTLHSMAPSLATHSCVGVNGVSVSDANSVSITASASASIVSVSHADKIYNNVSANPRVTSFLIEILHSLPLGIYEVYDVVMTITIGI
jgi:hypothetical protein